MERKTLRKRHSEKNEQNWASKLVNFFNFKLREREREKKLFLEFLISSVIQGLLEFFCCVRTVGRVPKSCGRSCRRRRSYGAKEQKSKIEKRKDREGETVYGRTVINHKAWTKSDRKLCQKLSSPQLHNGLVLLWKDARPQLWANDYDRGLPKWPVELVRPLLKSKAIDQVIVWPGLPIHRVQWVSSRVFARGDRKERLGIVWSLREFSCRLFGN